MHLEKEGLQFIQFAFRWVNCLLLREVPFALAVRLWDTYLSEGCETLVRLSGCAGSSSALERGQLLNRTRSNFIAPQQCNEQRIGAA